MFNDGFGGPGFGPGGGFFGGMPPFFAFFFTIVMVGIGFVFLSIIFRTVKNLRSPQVERDARVVAKRTQVSRGHHGGEHHHHHNVTRYYVTFQFENGDRLELSVSGKEYGQLVEGDEGYLRYQGDWFQGFRRYPGVQ